MVHYKAKQVFSARHRFVHKGERLENGKLPNLAVALGLSCLLNYSEATSVFKSKVDLVQYLDFIFLSDKVRTGSSKDILSQLSASVGWKPRTHKFAFI